MLWKQTEARGIKEIKQLNANAWSWGEITMKVSIRKTSKFKYGLYSIKWYYINVTFPDFANHIMII